MSSPYYGEGIAEATHEPAGSDEISLEEYIASAPKRPTIN
jgi:hypothetical protein